MDTLRCLYLLDAHRDKARARAALRAYGSDAGGMKVGLIEGLDLLWAEGRAAQLLDLGHGLLPASGIGDAHAALTTRLRDHLDVRYLRDEGTSRVDTTATYSFEKPSQGWALLRGLAALDSPRRKPALYGRPPETVYFLAPASGAVLERIYDRGVQHSTAPPGHDIRFEAQTRYRRDRRMAVGEWTSTRVRETFEHRFSPLRQSAGGLRVASEAALRETIRDLVADEKLSARQAELLLGHIAADSVGIRRPERTARRRRGELRRLGLAQALDGADEGDPVDVPLDDVLGDLLRSERWNA